jgi:hypothetical protein
MRRRERKTGCEKSADTSDEKSTENEDRGEREREREN